MGIGVDPHGGTDPNSGNVIWNIKSLGDSGYPKETWLKFEINNTIAQSDHITLFIYIWGKWHPGTNAYFDDVVVWNSTTIGSGGLAPKLTKTEIPKKSLLGQNYPNPFSKGTYIPFSLSRRVKVKIQLYNIQGQLIKTFDLGYKEAGLYIDKGKSVYWNGINESGKKVANGVYIYKIEAGDFISSKKMAIIR